MDFTSHRTKGGKTYESSSMLAPGTFEPSHKYPRILKKRPSGGNSSHPCPLAAGQARRRRGRTGGVEQARGKCNRAHMCTIRGGSLAGERPGDGRRRSSGGAAVAPWIPAQCR
jgi:hypothetical protein